MPLKDLLMLLVALTGGTQNLKTLVFLKSVRTVAGARPGAMEDGARGHQEPGPAQNAPYRSLGLLRLYGDPEVFRFFEYMFLFVVYGPWIGWGRWRNSTRTAICS